MLRLRRSKSMMNRALPFTALQKATPDRDHSELWDALLSYATLGVVLGLFWLILQTLYM